MRRLERAKGIEPSYAAWEAAVLPLNYARAAVLLAMLARKGNILRLVWRSVRRSMGGLTATDKLAYTAQGLARSPSPRTAITMGGSMTTAMTDTPAPAGSRPHRAAIICLAGGISAAFAGALMLWAVEGPRVFVDILLAGVAACL